MNKTCIEHCDKDIIIVCTYIPCENSTFYTRRAESNGIIELLDELSQLLTPDNYAMIMGDFNARTGGLCDYIIDDHITHLDLPGWLYDPFQDLETP